MATETPPASRLDQALAAYRAGRVTLARASAIAGLGLTEFLAQARRAGVLPCWPDLPSGENLPQVGPDS